MTYMPDIAKKIKLNQQEIEITERFDFLKALAADPRLTKTNAVAVAVYLISCRNGQTGLINPGYAKIAKGAGCSVSAAKNAVNKLEETGWFIVIGKKNSSGTNDSNTYIPNWDQARSGVADAPGVVAQTDEVVAQTDAGSSADRRRVVRLRAANSVNLNPVKKPSESTQETQDASGGLPADLSDQRSTNDESRYPEDIYPYDDETGPEYQPGGLWYEMDHNPLGGLNLQNEYSEIFADWPESDQPENLNRYMELRRSGVEFDRISLAAREVNGEVSIEEFLAGAWKHFGPSSVPFDDVLPVRKVSESVDWDNDPPF